MILNADQWTKIGNTRENLVKTKIRLRGSEGGGGNGSRPGRKRRRGGRRSARRRGWPWLAAAAPGRSWRRRWSSWRRSWPPGTGATGTRPPPARLPPQRCPRPAVDRPYLFSRSDESLETRETSGKIQNLSRNRIVATKSYFLKQKRVFLGLG